MERSAALFSHPKNLSGGSRLQSVVTHCSLEREQSPGDSDRNIIAPRSLRELDRKAAVGHLRKMWSRTVLSSGVQRGNNSHEPNREGYQDWVAVKRLYGSIWYRRIKCLRKCVGVAKNVLGVDPTHGV